MRAVHQRRGNAIVKLALSVLLRLRQQIWRGTRLRVDLPTRTRRAFDYLRLQDAKQECGGVRKEGSFQRVESCFRGVQLAEENERGNMIREETGFGASWGCCSEENSGDQRLNPPSENRAMETGY